LIVVNDPPGVAQVNKEDIEKYLRMLGQELQRHQVTGEILLAGGAVMLKALAHKLNISNAQDALTLVKKYVPEQLLVPRIEYIIEEIFE
jgi:hypothetical protein